MRRFVYLALCFGAIGGGRGGQTLAKAEVVSGYPEGVAAIEYPCSSDQTKQKALYYAPDSPAPAPLLVALHSWSGDYRQTASRPLAEACQERGWAFLHPDFRGRNRRPEACGSETAVQDVLDAVAFARRAGRVDAARIYLAGASGGGHMALIMAGRAPEIWAGVSAWVPIYDLAAWHAETSAAGLRYAGEIEACCGGPPGAGEAVDEEYRRRSPLAWLGAARGVALDINAGVYDGHRGSVPIRHALRAFNAVADPEDRLSDEAIALFAARPSVPSSLDRAAADPSYGTRQPLFRRRSGAARITIFDGGHEIVYAAAAEWLGEQRRALTSEE